MLSRGLVLVEKEGWLAKEERHDKVADKVAAVPTCVCGCGVLVLWRVW